MATFTGRNARVSLGGGATEHIIMEIGNWKIDTFWFNFAVIWLMTLVLYLTLLHDTLRKAVNFFSNVSLRRKEKK